MEGFMEASQLQQIRATLETELAAVERQLAEHGAAFDGEVEVSVDEGFADSAAATTERSELISLVEELQGRRSETVAALARIDEGTYGKCENCGRDIPAERLEALPTARLCVDCKQKQSVSA
jgi:RNA polymerase-binding transcription factor